MISPLGKPEKFDNKYCNQCSQTTRHLIDKEDINKSSCQQCGVIRHRQVSKRINDIDFKRH